MHPDEQIAARREVLDKLKAVLHWPSLDRLENVAEKGARLQAEFGEIVRLNFLKAQDQPDEWQMLFGFATALDDPNFAEVVKRHLEEGKPQE